MGVIRSLIGAVAFLTVLPVASRRPLSGGETRWTTAFYPLVGFLLGLLLYGLHGGALQVLPARLAALLVVLAWVLATGAMHLEGLADFCDGMFVSGPRERALECMRDPHVGAYGVIGVVLHLLLKWEVLASLDHDALAAALPFTCAFARYGAVVLLFFLPAAREDGMAKPYAREVPLFALITASAFLFAFAFPFGRVLIHVLIPMFLLTALLGAWVFRRLGGVSGDACGAAIELLELFTLAGILLATRQSVF